MQNNAQRRLAMVLNALGENAEDVANLLLFGGWQGLQHSANACPVALYLRTVVTDVADASVSSERATIHTTDGDDVQVELTPAVAGFVLAFDIGAYGELVVNPTDDNGDVIDDLEL